MAIQADRLTQLVTNLCCEGALPGVGSLSSSRRAIRDTLVAISVELALSHYEDSGCDLEENFAEN